MYNIHSIEVATVSSPTDFWSLRLSIHTVAVFISENWIWHGGPCLTVKPLSHITDDSPFWSIICISVFFSSLYWVYEIWLKLTLCMDSRVWHFLFINLKKNLKFLKCIYLFWLSCIPVKCEACLLCTHGKF